MTTAEIKEIWETLAAARLVAPQQLASLQQQMPPAAQTDQDAAWKWLVASGAVTPYHVELLRRGAADALWCGDFLLMQRIASGPWRGLFQGRHGPTGHLVAIDFFSPRLKFRGVQWPETARLAAELAAANTPYLVPTLGTVILPENSMVVSDWTSGRWLPEKLAVKARLPWESVAAIASGLALAVAELHQRQIIHGQIWPWTMELAGRSLGRLRVTWQLSQHQECKGSEALADYQAPEQLEDSQPTRAGDVFSLGCLMHRMIAGRSPTAKQESIADKIAFIRRGAPLSLDKYGVPIQLSRMISDMLAAKETDRPLDLKEISAALTSFALAPRNPDNGNRGRSPMSLRVSQMLSSSVDGESFGVITGVSRPTEIEEVAQSIRLSVSDEERKPRKRQTKWRRWLVPASLTGGMTLFVLGLVFGWMYLNQKSLPPLAMSGESTPKPPVNPSVGSVETRSVTEPPPSLIQQVVADDGLLLWESPTVGLPLDFSAYPPGVRILMAFRLHALLSDPQGELIVQSLGPDVAHWIGQVIAQSQFELREIELLQVGLYAGDGDTYAPLFRIVLSQPISLEQLAAKWSGAWLDDAEPSDTFPRAKMFRGSECDYLVWLEHGDQDSTTAALFGPKELIAAANEGGPRQSPSGVLQQLIELSDRQRHATIIFLSSALFNEMGQNLMAGAWSSFNRRLRLAFGEKIRGGTISFHVDQGNYLEVALNHQPDVNGRELSDTLMNELRMARDDAIAAVAELPADPYWNRVRLRLGNMLTDAVRRTRVGVERDHVIFNAWLPPSAVHNLLAANQTAYEFISGDFRGGFAAGQPEKTKPQTLAELLALPRSLEVTTNPDLNVLLQGIAEEVRADHPGLPFAFEIRLAGPDLLLEGITQNQRPGDFTLTDVPLAEILTTIVVRANPDKSITGPADEKCKLVWVIETRPDEEGGGERILVTTRQAARQRGLKLPSPFQSGSE